MDIEQEQKKMKETCVKAKYCQLEICPLQCGNYKEKEDGLRIDNK